MKLFPAAEKYADLIADRGGFHGARSRAQNIFPRRGCRDPEGRTENLK